MQPVGICLTLPLFYNSEVVSVELSVQVAGNIPDSFLNKNTIFLNRNLIFMNRNSIFINRNSIFMNKSFIFMNTNAIFLDIYSLQGVLEKKIWSLFYAFRSKKIKALYTRKHINYKSHLSCRHLHLLVLSLERFDFCKLLC